MIYRCCLCGVRLVEAGICDSCNDIRNEYRNVFSSSAGKRVLTSLLCRLNYFNEDLKTAEERHLQNFARHLLYLMGIFGPANAEKVVDGLLGIPAREKVAEEIADE